MVVDLPSALAEAIEQQLHGIRAGDLSRATEQLTARYRGESSGQPLARSREEILAYAAYRLPATYAAATATLTSVAELREDWSPRTMLDLGAGLGAAMWAATEVWPTLERMSAVDAHGEMIRVGQEFAQSASHPALRSGRWLQANLTGALPCDRHDLVLISYVLAEFKSSAIADLVHRAWELTQEVLVVIEPGTPEGYARVLMARDRLIEDGGFPIAPCPHAPPCTAGDGDWCHFAVRLPRSKIHRAAKGADLGYEDEKYSFVAVSRTPVPRIPPRVLRHPRIRGGHIYLQLCTPEGPKTMIVSKRDKEVYRRARKADWGALFDLPEHFSTSNESNLSDSNLSLTEAP